MSSESPPLVSAETTPPSPSPPEGSHDASHHVSFLRPQPQPRKSDEGPNVQPAPPQRYSTNPIFDVTSSSSTAYITLPRLDPPEQPTTPPPKGRLASFFHRNLGLFLIAGAQLFFSMMNLCAKLLSMNDPPIHPLEIIVVRMFITWLGSITYLYYTKVPDFIIGPKGVRLLLVLRGVTGFFGLFGIYFSLQYLDLSDATVLTFLSPILTGYCGRIFLKEPFLRTEVYAGILSLVGVVLIARPQSLFGSGGSYAGDATGLQRLSAVGVALLGVLGSAGAYTSIRAIGAKAHPLISVNMFSFYATTVAAIGMIILKIRPVFPGTIAGVVEWLVIGISGFVAQLMLTSGLQRERAGRGVSMVYLQMVFAFSFERLIWGIIPDFWSISGSGLILGGAIWVAVAKSKIKHDHPEDLERSEYIAVDGDENQKDNEFELGELSDDEIDEHGPSTSGSSSSEGQSKEISLEEQVEDLDIVSGTGELTGVNRLNEIERH